MTTFNTLQLNKKIDKHIYKKKKLSLSNYKSEDNFPTHVQDCIYSLCRGWLGAGKYVLSVTNTFLLFLFLFLCFFSLLVSVFNVFSFSLISFSNCPVIQIFPVSLIPCYSFPLPLLVLFHVSSLRLLSNIIITIPPCLYLCYSSSHTHLTNFPVSLIHISLSFLLSSSHTIITIFLVFLPFYFLHYCSLIFFPPSSSLHPPLAFLFINLFPHITALLFLLIFLLTPVPEPRGTHQYQDNSTFPAPQEYVSVTWTVVSLITVWWGKSSPT